MSRAANPKGAPRRPWGPRIRIDGARKEVIETGRTRVLVAGAVFALAFLAIAGRLVDLTAFDPAVEPQIAQTQDDPAAPVERADIVDRNGVLLATSLPTASLYADPAEVLDPVASADKLLTVLPDLNRDQVIARLSGSGRFVWIQRNLTPVQQYDVNRLGIPGLQFQASERRVYPDGGAAAHVLGTTDTDGRGIAGIEALFNSRLRSGGQPLALSLDIRVQEIVRDELEATVKEFKAIGAAGIVIDVNTGEILAMVSLPDFDPNQTSTMQGDAAFNRVTKGVYEMGSTFKLFTVATALDSGIVTLSDGYDASKPIHVARFTISDDHAQNRWLSVPEILMYSSNIGAAKMGEDIGTATQRAYLKRFGLLSEPHLEIPEVGSPLIPAHWRDINTMTISYGHGIAVSPLQVASATAALVNGGIRYAPTLLKRAPDATIAGERVVSPATSRKMRGLMELVVDHGTGRKAQVAGYRIGGKTGTADKEVGGRYSNSKVISSFVGAFPIEQPRYVVLALIDEPHGNASTYNFRTAGWVAAPAVGHIIKRMAPLMGIAPAPAGGEAMPKVVPRPAPAAPELLVAVRAAIADARESRSATR